AESAAAAAQKRLNDCLDANRDFRLEAGAGAGKTYSLVKALKRLIDEGGTSFLRRGQRVACITFTEVAREEIAQDIDK
uniref:UvrD-helicase domain-containing protein n=1 Tax=Klebsiella pneumoniae TaxID=573 RepID=UPI0013D6537C